MINRQVRQYYIDKENVDHSITDRLIQGGYNLNSQCLHTRLCV